MVLGLAEVFFFVVVLDEVLFFVVVLTEVSDFVVALLPELDGLETLFDVLPLEEADVTGFLEVYAFLVEETPLLSVEVEEVDSCVKLNASEPEVFSEVE